MENLLKSPIIAALLQPTGAGAALMFDMDNDGCNDIYVCNGVNKDVTNLDFMDFFANDVFQKMVLSGKKEAY